MDHLTNEGLAKRFYDEGTTALASEVLRRAEDGTDWWNWPDILTDAYSVIHNA